MPNKTVAGFRLSPQQIHLWQIQKQNARICRAHSAVLIEGGVQKEDIVKAVRLIADRYEILRTQFVCPAGMDIPLQVLGNAGESNVYIGDLGELNAGSLSCGSSLVLEDLKLQLETIEESSGEASFCAGIAQVSEGGHVLALSVSSLCADVLSLHAMVQEISESLAADSAGSSDESIQYADVSEWLNDISESEEREIGRKYWEHNGVGGASLNLPFIQRNVENVHFLPQRYRLNIPENTAQMLLSMTTDANNLSTLVLGAWTVVLSRSMNEPQSQLLFGISSDGRKYEDLRRVLGPFSKYLPVRIAYEPQSPFLHLVDQLQEVVDEARDWQEYYIAHDPEISLTHCYSFEERPPDLNHGDLRVSILDQHIYNERFDLSLSCVRQESRLWVELDYDSEKFDPETIERISGRLERVVERIVENPSGRVRELWGLSEVERAEIRSWQGEKREYERGVMLPEILRRVAEEQGEAEAVECEGKRISYGELNRRANQIARGLQESGVKAEEIVGLCVERSVEMVVGIVGIMKSGAAYLPLDPGYPVERLRYMMEDSGVRVVLSSREMMPVVAGGEREVWLVEEEEWEGYSGEELESGMEEEQLAYVIYTSGSTGKPKGVGVSQGNLLHSTEARWRRYEEKVEGYLLVSSFAFDSSVAGLYWTLGQGGKLHLPGEGKQKDAEELVKQIEREGITHVLCLPSLYGQMLEVGGGERLRSVRVAIVAGESCGVELVDKHEEKLGGRAKLYNEYGPTEGTVWSTVYEVEKEKWNGSGIGGRGKRKRERVPIGKPIANTEVYVLDEEMEPVPVGVVGELYVGGGGVARGYVKRAELTAERFVPKPKWQREEGEEGEREGRGERLYRTGDQGRWNVEGELEFMGRRDQQVKVRGYRIELGEIETALNEHPQVQQAVVVVRGGEKEVGSLAGYWVQKGEMGPGHQELKIWLQQRLPEYMVPNVFIKLKELPLTANGKVDRNALVKADLPMDNGDKAAPRTPIEEVVAAVWSELLKRKELVNIEDSFFELGGHSLLATQVVSRLRTLLNVEIPLSLFFAAPTVGQLARRIEDKQREEQWWMAPPLKADHSSGPQPLSFAQQRLWFMNQLHPEISSYNIYKALRIRGEFNAGALDKAFVALVERHEALRTRFDEQNGDPVQIIDPVSSVRLVQIDLQHFETREQRMQEAHRLLNREAQKPYDLRQGPVIRMLLLHLAEHESIVFLGMHHIVSDGWSMGLLIQEFLDLYRAFTLGKPSPLKALPVQYAAFARWQRAWLQGNILDRHLTYWKKHLEGVTTLSLPTDYPRPMNMTHQSGIHHFRIAKELTAEIKQLSRHEGATLFMTLMAAFQCLLSWFAHQTDIAVGTDIANRNYKETEAVIGFFVNQLVIRTSVTPELAFTQLIDQVRKNALDAYAHQDLPFEKLVEVLAPVRHGGLSPLVEVKFVLQNIPLQMSAGVLKKNTSTLEITEEHFMPARAKFDLLLSISDNSGTLQGAWEYRAELFEHGTIQRLAFRFEQILAAVVEKPAITLTSLVRQLDEADEAGVREASASRLTSIKRKEVSLSGD